MKLKMTMMVLAITLAFTNCNDNKPSDDEHRESNVQTKPVIVEPVINIVDIANKSLKEVSELLGKPNNTEKAKPSGTPCKTNPCDRAFYKEGKFEIVFINKVADWITINDVSSLPMTEDVITCLGLPKSKPSYSNPSNVIKWSNIKGYKEISFFNNGLNKVDYIYIKINTP